MTKPDYFSKKLTFFITLWLIFLLNEISYSQTPGTLYGSTGNVGATLIIIDPATGTGTSVGSLGTFGPVTEIEFRDDGILFGSTGQLTSNIITIDPLTGTETLIGMHQFGATNGLEFDSDNNLLGSYFHPNISVDLVQIDQTTGQFITTLGVIGSMTITGLTFHPDGTLYGVGHNGGGTPSQLYTIDPATGVPTLVGPIGFDNVGALEFGPDSLLYGGVGIFGGSSAGDLIIIDPNTGAGTSVGPTGFSGISGLSFVPEITAVEQSNYNIILEDFVLEQNYPNPFNPTTTIRFELKQSGQAVLKIFDILSKEIDRLIDEVLSPGSYKVTFEANALPSGIYFYSLESGGLIQVKKMILMK